MTHKVVDFDIHAGDTLEFDVTVTDDGTAAGTPVDLTGCTITWALATTEHSPTRAITKTIGSGITITDAANGVFTVALAADDTIDLTGRYQHQARVTDPVGNKTTVVKGVVDIDRTILAADE